jgi:antitoxin component of RelBE/YafQ-DinJ toxin-antitoxin module
MKKEKSINIRLTMAQSVELSALLLSQQIKFHSLDLTPSDVIRMAIRQMAEREMPWRYETASPQISSQN